MVNDYTVLDLETTGLSVKEDRIIEIAAARVRNGVITAQYETFIKPGKSLRPEIIELTGISEADLAGAPEPSTAIPEVLRFIAGDILVGHRIIFDYSFLKRAASYLKLPFEMKGIDTLPLARAFLPELESKSLVSLCEYFHITHIPHRAMGDVMATKELYDKLSDFPRFERLAIPRQLIHKVKKETPVTKSQKEQLYKLLNKHKLIIDYDIDTLTRNEASRIMDKIFAAYGR